MDNRTHTIENWDKVADLYQSKFMDLDAYDHGYDLFCKWLQPKGARVFEIGCGPGNITRQLLNRRPDIQITATDVAPSMVQLAKVNNPSATCLVIDSKDILTIATAFHGIVCGFCMPYLSMEESAKLVSDFFQLLYKDGIVYLSFIEGDYDKSGFETSSCGRYRMFVYYHSENFIRECFKDTGFEVLHFERLVFERPGKPPSIELIWIAQKIMYLI
jgi:methylase of polypeptide subunit release factors